MDFKVQSRSIFGTTISNRHASTGKFAKSLPLKRKSIDPTYKSDLAQYRESLNLALRDFVELKWPEHTIVSEDVQSIPKADKLQLEKILVKRVIKMMGNSKVVLHKVHNEQQVWENVETLLRGKSYSV